MNFKEYAQSKLDGYTSLSWVINNVVIDDATYVFETKDLDGVCRKHHFSENNIAVTTIDKLSSTESGTSLDKPTKVRAKKAQK